MVQPSPVQTEGLNGELRCWVMNRRRLDENITNDISAPASRSSQQAPYLQFSVSFVEDCFVADAPRNDLAIIFAVIASPDARDKLREAISGITISSRIDEGIFSQLTGKSLDGTRIFSSPSAILGNDPFP